MVAGGEWGCLHDDSRNQKVTVGKKFYVYQSFTKHIRPGDQFVAVTGEATAIAAISEARGEAVIVLVNREKAPVTVRAMLWGLQKSTTQAQAVQTSATQDAAPVDAVAVRDDTIEVTVPAESVTRLLLRDVE